MTGMRVTVDRRELRAALKRMRMVSKARTKIPILADVRLVARDGVLSLAATDLDVSLLADLPAKVGKGGGFAVSTLKLWQALGAFQDAEVELTEDEGWCAASGRRGTVRLLRRSLDDFPSLGETELPDGPSLRCDNADLHEAMDSVLFSVPDGKGRFKLSSCQLRFDGDAMRWEATDGYRLAVATAKAEGEPFTALVPRLALRVAASLDGAEALIRRHNTKTSISVGAWTIIFKAEDASFPDVDAVLKRAPWFDSEAIMDHELLARSIAAMDGLRDFFSSVRLTGGGSELSLASDGHETKVSLAVSCEHAGRPVFVALRARFVLDYLKMAKRRKAPKVCMQSSGPNTMTRWSLRFPDGEGSVSSFAVIMPMRNDELTAEAYASLVADAEG